MLRFLLLFSYRLAAILIYCVSFIVCVVVVVAAGGGGGGSSYDSVFT